jgi:hypothetical protein
MKKETKVYTVLTHEEALRKKGFIKASYYDEGNNIVNGLVMTKSIYDKRFRLVLDEIDKYYGNVEYPVKQLKENIERIKNGDFDGMEL